jgi:hypothetical protein
MMEVICSTEMSADFYWTTRRYVLEYKDIFTVTAVRTIKSNYTYLLTHGAEPFLRSLQLYAIQELPEFYGTRRFNTVFTRVLHWSLSRAISVQSTPSHFIAPRFIFILSTHIRLGLLSDLFPSGFPTNILYAFLFSPIRATCPAHFILLDLIILILLGEDSDLDWFLG